MDISPRTSETPSETTWKPQTRHKTPSSSEEGANTALAVRNAEKRTTPDQEIKTEHNPRNQPWNNTQDTPAAQVAETTYIAPAQTRKTENAKTRSEQDTKEPHPQAHYTTKQEKEVQIRRKTQKQKKWVPGQWNNRQHDTCSPENKNKKIEGRKQKQKKTTENQIWPHNHTNIPDQRQTK